MCYNARMKNGLSLVPKEPIQSSGGKEKALESAEGSQRCPGGSGGISPSETTSGSPA